MKASLVVLVLLVVLIKIAPAFAAENTGGATGDGSADDTAALQGVLDRGETIVLGEGKTYRITRRLDIRHDNSGVVGDGTATIMMDAGRGAFDNTGEQKYGEHAVGIQAAGVSGIRIEGLRIRYDKSHDDRVVKAIALRQCSDFRITGNDIADFSKADGIVYVGACTHGVVASNDIHDGYTNSATRGQITGIVLDDDDAGSSDVRIADNHIHDLTVGAEFFAKFNYQTDGINITVRTHDVTIEHNRIENVGEAVDSFATNVRIVDNDIRSPHAFGIKLVHGASDTLVARNVIRDAGLGGIVLSGSTSVDRDTAGNVIERNVIAGVNRDRALDRFTTFGIGITRGGKTRVVGTRIDGNTIRTGPGAKVGILVESGSGRDNAVGGNSVKGGRLAPYLLDPAAASATPQ